MNYNLAKSLKDAGFPQIQFDPLYPTKKGVYLWKDNGDRIRELNVQKGEVTEVGLENTVYEPTLSELINACGDLFVLHSPKSLDVNEEYYVHGDIWTAYSQRKETDTKAEGLTPEEAVTKLWLTINASK